MEYRLEIGIVDSGVLSDNFIEFYYSELQISGRVFDSSIGYTILISKRPISSYIKINYSLQSWIQCNMRIKYRQHYIRFPTIFHRLNTNKEKQFGVFFDRIIVFL